MQEAFKSDALSEKFLSSPSGRPNLSRGSSDPLADNDLVQQGLLEQQMKKERTRRAVRQREQIRDLFIQQVKEATKVPKALHRVFEQTIEQARPKDPTKREKPLFRRTDK